MKAKYYKGIGATAIACMLFFSSCLKDNGYINFAGVGTLIELPLSAHDGLGNLVPEANGISATPTLLPTIVNVASPKPLTSALSVTLELDPADLAAYNTANSTSYNILPPADYSVTSWTVTVPANQREATLSINLNTTLIDPSQVFVLPIKIASASGQNISNYSVLLYAIQVKNQYDDTYAATGYVFHPSAPRAINATYAVTTVGAIRCQAPVADLGASNYFFDFDVQPPSGGTSVLANWSAFGSTPAAPASGFMTADNPAGVAYAPATDGNGVPGGAFYNSATFNNTYTTSTKTFMMHFGYGGGSTSQTGYTRQFYMKLVGN